MTVTTADVLRHAMELITPGGAWIQGEWHRNPIPSIGRPAGYCTSGAIYRAEIQIDPRNMDSHVCRDAFGALHQAIGCENIPKWNDDPSRTQEDVLLAFKHAIEIAEDSQ